MSTPTEVQGQEKNLVQTLDTFFFEPVGNETLSVIRIFTGFMLAYIHFVWLLDLSSFLGPHALIDNTTWKTVHPSPDYKWTYLAIIDSLLVARIHELIALGAGLLMGLGLFTRVACIVAWFLTLMTTHRMTGFLFGLDQIALMLAMYLCLSRSGNGYSVDRFLVQKFPHLARARWFGWFSGVLVSESKLEPKPCWSNRLSTRLIQLHLCVIYLFGGIGKMRGETWWDGSALWYSLASYEYQSMDMTWVGRFPFVASIATHITVFWEMAYCAIIWPRWTRPLALGIAVLVHGGIAFFLGMVTFGLMMIVANFSFVSPTITRSLVNQFIARLFRKQS